MLPPLTARFGKIERIQFKIPETVAWKARRAGIDLEACKRAALIRVAEAEKGVPLFPEWTEGLWAVPSHVAPQKAKVKKGKPSLREAKWKQNEKAEKGYFLVTDEPHKPEATELKQRMADAEAQYLGEQERRFQVLPPHEKEVRLFDIQMRGILQNYFPRRPSPPYGCKTTLTDRDINSCQHDTASRDQAAVLRRYGD